MGKIKGWNRDKTFRARPTTKLSWVSDNRNYLDIDYVPSSNIPYKLIYNGKQFDSTGTLKGAKRIAINWMRKHPRG